MKYIIQSILFDKNKFTIDKAVKWALNNKLKVLKVHTTDNKIRLRQEDPTKLKELGYTIFETVHISEGIDFIVAI